MKFRLASFAALAAAVASFGSLAQAEPQKFDVDAVHSAVIFRIQHMGAGYTYGRFNGISGSVTWDAANPSASSVSIKVATASVDTGNKDRDNHLRSPDFFDAAKFPEITFSSTSVKASGTTLEVAGKLSLHGVTKDVTVTMEKTGEGKGREGEALVGFEGVLQIKRTDYGMTYGAGALGDDVRLTIAIEAMRK
ncbi:MAG: YceI family protein [Planctomycetota bacterium]